MQKVIRYECDKCGKLFYTEEQCFDHEEMHKKIDKANRMLKDGHTLKEIQQECRIWYKVPEHLENVTQDVGFVISYWQCCKKPAYHIFGITFDGRLIVRGCGSWAGYYGGELEITSSNLKDPKIGEPIFVDPRYHPY